MYSSWHTYANLDRVGSDEFYYSKLIKQSKTKQNTLSFTQEAQHIHTRKCKHRKTNKKCKKEIMLLYNYYYKYL